MLSEDQRCALDAAGLGLSDLKRLLREEEEVRLSPQTQEVYGRVESGTADDGDGDWLDVTDRLQRDLVRRAGVPARREAAALWLLRCASQIFPSDPELMGPSAISLYVRHQRAGIGSLCAGDPAPDVPLLTLEGSPTSVCTACGARPTLLVAGSFT